MWIINGKQRAKTRARLEELKKPRVIPREKPPANFYFKHAAFDLPSPPQPIPSVSKESPLVFERSIGRNPFDLRTNPSTFSSLLLSLSSSFPLLSNPLLVENPCYRFYSSSPSPSEPKPLRPLPAASLQLPLALLKLFSIAEPAAAPSSTASFDFFGYPPWPELTSCTGE